MPPVLQAPSTAASSVAHAMGAAGAPPTAPVRPSVSGRACSGAAAGVAAAAAASSSSRGAPNDAVASTGAPRPVPNATQAPARKASAAAPAPNVKRRGVDYSKFDNIDDSDDDRLVAVSRPILPYGLPRERVTRDQYYHVWRELLSRKELPLIPAPDLEQLWGYYKYGGMDEQALLDQACEILGSMPRHLPEDEWKKMLNSLVRLMDHKNREDEARMFSVIYMCRFPQDSDPFYNHGVLLMKMSDRAKFGGAPKTALPTLDDAPRKLVPTEQYCQVFLKAAMANYRRSVKLDPKGRASYINLIGCLERYEPSGWQEAVHELGIAAVRNGVWYSMWQRPPHFVSKLRASPWHDAQDFSLCRALERHYPTIRAEYDAYMEKLAQRKDWDDTDQTPGLSEVGSRPGALHDGGLQKSGHWREAPLFCNATVREDFACFFPHTVQVLQQHCADATGLAFCGGGDVIFSVLTPGTTLRPHCGPSNTRLTCHLGIRVPRTLKQGCRIRVAAEPPRGWDEGRCIVFDDSFEHEVIYEDAEPYQGERVVLLANFWHPDFEFKNDPQWRTKSDALMASCGIETLPQTTVAVSAAPR
eukprot:NODE_2597_length_2184_cov_6.882839.p1 GENE.NODE_2597_length_2184_cov_6.882839~~NODE_2597_length_2184_cov_6.882839.p1  ORF type:complete len:632 (+),score=181.46 NODE_2597_length_2184_cov_6.882839:139-1896(+)